MNVVVLGAEPGVPLQALKWLLREDAPLLFRLRADAYVLALGSYSPLLARPIGIDSRIYPLKGYSVTMPVKDLAAAWNVSLSDEAHKLVLSPLGARLRIASTAELNGYNTEINRVRCEAKYRSRHARLDPPLRLGSHPRRPRQRPPARRVNVYGGTLASALAGRLERIAT